MILDLMLLIPQLITPQRLQHANTFPSELLLQSHVTVIHVIISGVLVDVLFVCSFVCLVFIFTRYSLC